MSGSKYSALSADGSMAKTSELLGCQKLLLHKMTKKRAGSFNLLPPHISIANRQKDLSISSTSVRKAVVVLCRFLAIQCEELSLYFVTQKKISDLHSQFFDDPTPTDCITFPLDNAYLGDLFICPKTAILYAQKHSLDPYKETLLYIVHGLLHLVGFEDKTTNGRRTMRKMEKKCMEHLEQHSIVLTPASR